MIYLIANGKLIETDEKDIDNNINNKSYIGIFDINEKKPELFKNQINENFLEHILLNDASRFESHEALDVLCISIYNDDMQKTIKSKIYFFIQENIMQIICTDKQYIKDVFNKILIEDYIPIDFGKLLYNFFELLITKDVKKLDNFDEHIGKLENDILIHKKKTNYSKKIITLKRKLRAVKRHYDAMLDIYDEILVNENNLFDKQTLKLFKILRGRVSRLYNKVLNLLDYVTEIREAYQSEVDISLNKTMRILTAVTIIFMPITLISTWYGMNFNMPEYSWKIGYPVIIIISLILTFLCICYFKKKKWF